MHELSKFSVFQSKTEACCSEPDRHHVRTGAASRLVERHSDRSLPPFLLITLQRVFHQLQYCIQVTLFHGRNTSSTGEFVEIEHASPLHNMLPGPVILNEAC